MNIGYWKFYDDKYNWDDAQEWRRPDLGLTKLKLESVGISDADARKFIASGFVYEKLGDSIIDRYYGGLLMSTDMRTRIPLKEFPKLVLSPQSRVRVHRADSWTNVRRTVDDLANNCKKRLLFRGQKQNHLVKREVNNPLFVVPGLGEISLIPSLWRKMLKKRTDAYVWFQSLARYEWSQMLDSVFDLEDIERRKRIIAGDKIAFYNNFDFEDCADPVLQDYAKCQLDVQMGHNQNLATLLTTLLQHYGLDSTVLDLTTSLDVAMFFATHEFQKETTHCDYKFIGTNARKSVIYVLRENKREMQAYESDERFIEKLFPLRPQRQDCVISTSGPYALNLPADFLECVILLDFDTTEIEDGPKTEFLFPSDAEDIFLRAIKTNPQAREHIADFAKPTDQHN